MIETIPGGQDPSTFRAIRNLDDEAIPEVPKKAQESQVDFANRIEQMTGIKFDNIPVSAKDPDSLYQVLAVRDKMHLVKTEEGEFLIVKTENE
jgi:hypothetical protein